MNQSYSLLALKPVGFFKMESISKFEILFAIYILKKRTRRKILERSKTFRAYQGVKQIDALPCNSIRNAFPRDSRANQELHQRVSRHRLGMHVTSLCRPLIQEIHCSTQESSSFLHKPNPHNISYKIGKSRGPASDSAVEFKDMKNELRNLAHMMSIIMSKFENQTPPPVPQDSGFPQGVPSNKVSNAQNSKRADPFSSDQHPATLISV